MVGSIACLTRLFAFVSDARTRPSLVRPWYKGGIRVSQLLSEEEMKREKHRRTAPEQQAEAAAA